MCRPPESRDGRSPVERLLDVAWRPLAEARGQALAAERPVGGEARRRLAFGERCASPRPARSKNACPAAAVGRDELLGDAVADDGEEADLLARGADLGRDALGSPERSITGTPTLDLRGEDPAVRRRLALELAADAEVEVEVGGHASQRTAA